MPIEFRCKKCNKRLRVPDTAVGKKAKCSCGHVIVVSAPSAPVVETASSVDTPQTVLLPPKVASQDNQRTVVAAPQVKQADGTPPVLSKQEPAGGDPSDAQTIVAPPNAKSKVAENIPIAEALDTKQIPKAEFKRDADATFITQPSQQKEASKNQTTEAVDATGIITPHNRGTEGFAHAPEKQSAGTTDGAKYFGTYQIISELGRGGMGVVYKAHDPKLNREVAIKVLIAGEDASVDAIKRFHKEAEATAKLQHPNVVSIFDIGVQGNQHYFAMEFVKGKPLNEIIKSGEMKTSDKLALMAKVAKAMDYCHQQGILHRDLKPANIFVTPNNEPKIMDFGLAKITESEDAHLTRTGTIMGTPSYMSPEQAESSKDIDARTDVWALGVILYEMLCGELPFKGNSSMEVLTKVALDEPTPLIKKTKVSTDINTVVMKCLEKDRKNRYATADDLAKDLDALVNQEPISAKPPSTARKFTRIIKRNKLAAAITAGFLLFIVVGILFGWHYYKKAQLKPEVMAALDALKPGETNIPDALNALRPYYSNPVGLEILADEINSKSEVHRWGAIIACQKTASENYGEAVFFALTNTTNPFVEQAAWDYLKKPLPLDKLLALIEKDGGIRNLQLAETVFVQYGTGAGMDKLEKISIRDWSPDLIQTHSKILGMRGVFTYLQQLKTAATEDKKIEIIESIRKHKDYEQWKKLAAPTFVEITRSDPSAKVRYSALSSLENTPDLLANSIQILENDPDSAMRRYVTQFLFFPRNQTALSVLIKGAKTDKDASVRNACLQTAARFVDTDTSSHIVEILNKDGEDSVKRIAIDIITKRNIREALPILMELTADYRQNLTVETVRHHSEHAPPLCLVAARTMTQLGDYSHINVIVYYNIVKMNSYATDIQEIIKLNKRKECLDILLDFATNDPDDNIRNNAWIMLRQMKAVEIAPATCPLFEDDKYAHLRKNILHFWEQCPPDNCDQLLLKLLNHPSGYWRLNAVEALLSHRVKEALPIILDHINKRRFINDRGVDCNEAVLNYIKESHWTEGRYVLLRVLVNNDDAQLRRTSVAGLTVLLGKDASHYVLYGAAHNGNPESAVKYYAQIKCRLPYPNLFGDFFTKGWFERGDFIEALKSDESVPFVCKTIKYSSSEQGVILSANALIENKAVECIPNLITLLKERETQYLSDKTNRVLSALTGEKFTDYQNWSQWWEKNKDKYIKEVEREKANAVRIFKEESSPSLRIAAVKKIFRYSATEAIPDMKAALADPKTDDELKFHTVWMLAMLKEPDSAPFFTELLSNNNQELVQASIWFLAEIKKPEATPQIASTLGRTDNNVTRLYALNALGTLGVKSSVADLEKFLSGNKDIVLERVACEALQKITGEKCGNTFNEWQNWKKLNPDKIKQK